MDEGKCTTKYACVISFSTPDGECYLSFAKGVKFDFKYVSTSHVRLEKENKKESVEFIIPAESFLKLFEIV